MRQTALLRFFLGALLGWAVFTGAFVAKAFGHPTATFLSARTTIRVSHRTVLGHPVRSCTWRPGDARVRGLVRYSKIHQLTVPGWSGAGRKLSRASCAENGSTYQTAPGHNQWRPSGTVFAGGRRIRGVMDAPAVGFIGGHVFFGARNARRRGSGNIVAQLAYLVRHGRAQTSRATAPWTTLKQWSCGPVGSDGPVGCSRSCVVKFRNGRVGLVEIMHASMPLAARILARMGVVTATTGDSGGAAGLWTVTGLRNVPRPQVGRYFGAAMGTAWHRRIVDAIVVNARKL